MIKKTLWLLLLACAIRSEAHDYFLLPESFFLKKGDAFVCHLFEGDDFTNAPVERPISKTIAGYHWLNAVRMQELLTRYPDSTMPVLDDHANVAGLQLVAMETGNTRINFSPEKFTAYLKARHQDVVLKMRAGLRQRRMVRGKYTQYIKTLIMTDNASAGLYQNRLGQKLEIILLQNPYTTTPGGRITAQIWFDGTPLPKASVGVLCKAVSGTTSTRTVETDKKGQATFKADKAGTWMIRVTHMMPSKEASADWEIFGASYTFGLR